MPKIDLKEEKELNFGLVRVPGVNAAVHAKAHQLAGVARSKLASHHKTGDMHITVTKGDFGVDSFVNLEGKGAVSFEFGHVNSGKYAHLAPKRVPAARVLGNTKLEARV